MAYAPIAYTIPQYEDYPNNWLKAYEQGTTTPLAMATDATGGTTLAKSELDAQGFPLTAGAARFIPFIDGDYDLWLFPTEAEADANDTTNAIQFADNLNADPASSVSAADVTVADVDEMYEGTTVEAVLAEVNSSVESIAELKLIDPSAVTGSKKTIRVRSYYTPNLALAIPYDGGGGDFSWDSTSTETADDGMIVQATSVVTGRWIRLVDQSERINVKWYGAKGDGTTDDTTVIQACLDYCAANDRDAYAPGGTYLTGSLEIKEASGLYGEGWFQTEFKLADNTNDSHIKLLDTANRWNTLENFSMEGNKLNQTGTSHGITMIRESGSGFSSGGDFVLRDLWVKNYLSDGVSAGGFCNGTLLDHCFLNFNDGNGYNSFAGDQILSNTQAFNNGLAGFNDNTVGNSYSNCKAWFNGANGGVEADGDFGGNGSHDGAANAATLTDSTQALITDMFVGKTILNVTDGSSGTVTSNTATTITATLSGGTDNDWDVGDIWSIGETVTRIAGFWIRGGVVPANGRRLAMASCQSQENYGDGFNFDGCAGVVAQIIADGNSITYAPGELRQSTSRIYDGIMLGSATNCQIDVHCDVFQQTISPVNTRPTQRYGVNIDASSDENFVQITALNHDTGFDLNFSSGSPTNSNVVQLNGVAMEGIEQTISNVSAAANPYGVTLLDASTAFTQASMGAGIISAAGTIKTFRVTDATNVIQIVITEYIGGTFTATMSAIGDTITFQSNGLKWIPIVVSTAPTNVTISGGVITISNPNTNIGNEASAATDDLDTINGGYEGQEITIAARFDTQTVVAKDGTGNLDLAGDFSMDNSDDMLTLKYRNGTWKEVSRSDNGV